MIRQIPTSVEDFRKLRENEAGESIRKATKTVVNKVRSKPHSRK